MSCDVVWDNGHRKERLSPTVSRGGKPFRWRIDRDPVKPIFQSVTNSALGGRSGFDSVLDTSGFCRFKFSVGARFAGLRHRCKICARLGESAKPWKALGFRVECYQFSVGAESPLYQIQRQVRLTVDGLGLAPLTRAGTRSDGGTGPGSPSNARLAILRPLRRCVFSEGGRASTRATGLTGESYRDSYRTWLRVQRG